MTVSEQADLNAYDVEGAPDGACVRYEVCRNVVPARGQICDPCLDELHTADRKQREGR